MDFAAALKKLEKETNTSSSGSQQQRDGHRNNREEGGGAQRGRGGGGGGGQRQPHAGGGGDRGRNYYGNGGSSGGGGDRRRGRNEYDSHRDSNDRQRNQRPRYNNNNNNNNNNSQRGGGRSDRVSGGGSKSYYARDHSKDSHSRGRDRSGSGGGSNNNSNSSRSWPLEEMHRFGYHVSPIPYHRRRISNNSIMKLPADLGNRPFHIALLCICIDSLPFEHLWREWAQTGNAHVSLLVHAKYPDKIVAQAKREEEEESDNNRPAVMVRDRLLIKPPRIGRGKSYADPEYLTHTPAWGSVQITRAMLELLTAASIIGTPQDTERSDVRFMSQRFLLPKKTSNNDDKNGVVEVVGSNDIPPVDKFIFISETCIPVQTLQECEDALFGDKALYTSFSCQEEKPTAGSEQQEQSSSTVITPWEVSWVNARHPQTSPGTPRNKYERDQFQDLHAMIPIENRWKADQWHCLSRPHALAVLELDAHLRPHLQLWNSFTRINASDEMYFPTALSIIGILNTKDFISSSTTTTGSDANDPKQTLKEDSDKVAVAATAGTVVMPSAAAATTTSATATVCASSIALRPITYTDWSEGMRNPATFSKGMRDFCRIAKLARQQGSLVARKFALVCPSVVAINDSKNNSNDDNKVVVEQTGQITASEWRNEVERMTSDAAAAVAQKMKESPEAATLKSSDMGDAVKGADSS